MARRKSRGCDRFLFTKQASQLLARFPSANIKSATISPPSARAHGCLRARCVRLMCSCLLPDQRATPVETTLNMVTGEATRRRLLPSPPTLFLEFPQIRQSLLGRQTRFGYAVVVDTFGSSTGLVKLDLRVCVCVLVLVLVLVLGLVLVGKVS